jgi:peptidoglycan hydrolase-like protein with peptidoglycan-binding domain
VPGANIKITGGQGSKLLIAEGLLLTLTDPDATERQRDRAREAAANIVEGSTNVEVARALAAYVLQEVATTGNRNAKYQQAKGDVVHYNHPGEPDKPEKRGGKGKAGPAKPKEPAQPGDSQFEKMHPRGRGGMWIKKGNGMGKEQPNQNVAQMQRRLQQLGYGPGAPDGKFGDLTQAALAKFQQDYGLQGDGSQLDPATLQVLQNPPAQKLADIQAQNRAMAGLPDAQGKVPTTGGSSASAGTAASSAATGSTGTSATGTTAAGQETTTTTLDTGSPESVRAFQQAHGLQVDGVVGPNTQAMMKGLGVTPLNNDGTATTTTPAASASSSTTKKTATKKAAATSKDLSLGTGVAGRSSPQVKEAQQALSDLGYDTGGVDGRFGPETKKAVQKLQRRYGLKADGIIGKKTAGLMKRLAKRQAKKADSKDTLTSADEMLQSAEDRYDEMEHKLIEAREKRIAAERAGDVDAFVEYRAREVALTENLHTFTERLHPRDRLGKWVKGSFKPDAPEPEFNAHDKVFIKPHGSGPFGGPGEVGEVIGSYNDMHFGGQKVYRVRTTTGPIEVYPDGLRLANDNDKATPTRPFVLDRMKAKRAAKHKIVLTDEDRAFPETAFWPEARAERKKAMRKPLTARLAEATERRVAAEPGSEEFTVARAREEAIAEQLMEGKAISAQARKASATVVRTKPDGSKDYKFPIPDKDHAKAALAYLNKSDLSDEEKKKVRAKAKAKLKEAEEDEAALDQIEADDIVMVEMLVGDYMEGADDIEEAAGSLMKASTHKHGLEKKKGRSDNWVERTGPGGGGGQLPAYIQHIALAIRKKGKSTSRAIAIAIGTVKRWARGGGNVDANTRAAAAKALAEWEAMKAKNKAKKVAEAEGLDIAEFNWREVLHPRDRRGKFRDGLGRMDERTGKWRGNSESTFTRNTRMARSYAARRNAEPESAAERAGRLDDERFQSSLKSGMQDPGVSGGSGSDTSVSVGDIVAQAGMGMTRGPDTPAARKSLLKGLETRPDSDFHSLSDRDAIWLHTATGQGEDYYDLSVLHQKARAELDRRKSTSSQARGYLRGLAVYEAVWNGHLHPRNRNGKFKTAAYNPTSKTERLPGAIGKGLTGERGDGETRMYPDNIPAWRTQPTHDPGPSPSKVLGGLDMNGRTGTAPSVSTSGPDSLPGSFDAKVGTVRQPSHDPQVRQPNGRAMARDWGTAMGGERVLHGGGRTDVVGQLGGKDNLTPDAPDYTDPLVTSKMSLTDLTKAAIDDMRAQGKTTPRTLSFATALSSLGVESQMAPSTKAAVIRAFLNHSAGWTGKTAKGIKAELGRRVKALEG